MTWTYYVAACPRDLVLWLLFSMPYTAAKAGSHGQAAGRQHFLMREPCLLYLSR